MTTPPQDNSGSQWNPAESTPGDGASNPYQSQTGGKFGTDAYTAGADYNAPMNEPKQFSLLKTLTLVSLVIYLISGVISVVATFSDETREAIITELEAAGMATDAATVDGSLIVGAAFSVIITVIALALYLIVYFGLKSVKNWARIMGIVFAILGVVLTLGMFALDTAAMASTLGLISVVISVAWAGVSVYWLVLAFSAPVKNYIQSRQF